MGEKELMLGVPDDMVDAVELMERRAVIDIPENAVEIEIRAKVYEDGKLIDVSKKMSMQDVRAAIHKGDDYIDDDDVFVLTEKGKEYLDHSGGEDTPPF